ALSEPASANERNAGPNFAVSTVYALAKVVQFALPILWLWYLARKRFENVKTSLLALKPNSRGLGIGLAFGLLVAAGILLVYFSLLRSGDLLAQTPALVREKVSQFGSASPVRYLLLGLFLCGVNSLMEEYYWRWFVFGELQNVASFATALILSSLAFMGHHVI